MRCERALGVIGPAWLVPDLAASWQDEAQRETLLEAARLAEHEPVLGPRILAVGGKNNLVWDKAPERRLQAAPCRQGDGALPPGRRRSGPLRQMRRSGSLTAPIIRDGRCGARTESRRGRPLGAPPSRRPLADKVTALCRLEGGAPAPCRQDAALRLAHRAHHSGWRCGARTESRRGRPLGAPPSRRPLADKVTALCRLEGGAPAPCRQDVGARPLTAPIIRDGRCDARTESRRGRPARSAAFQAAPCRQGDGALPPRRRRSGGLPIRWRRSGGLPAR